MIKKIAIAVATGALVVSLASCASDKPVVPQISAQQLKINNLQAAKASLESQQSKNLIEIRSLSKDVAVDRTLASQMQKQSDPLVASIKKLNDQYDEITNSESPEAVAIKKQIVDQTRQNAELEQSINSYRADANTKQQKLTELNEAMSKSSTELVKVDQELKQPADSKVKVL